MLKHYTVSYYVGQGKNDVMAAIAWYAQSIIIYICFKVKIVRSHLTGLIKTSR